MPPQLMLHDADDGQRSWRLPQELVPEQLTAHAPVSAQRRSRPPQEETPEHSTRHFIPGGQSMRRIPHDVGPAQRTRHVSAMQPPLQISGHFIGAEVIPDGQPAGASSLGTVTSTMTSGLAESDVVVSSGVSVAGASSLMTLVSLVVEESTSSSTKAPLLADPPHALERRKTATHFMSGSCHAAHKYGSVRAVRW